MTFKKPTLITITGPTCSGKTTLHSLMVESGLYSNPVSFTTRNIRPGEVDGVDYFFTSREQLSENNTPVLERNDFLGNLYGMFEAEMTAKILSDKPPALIVDINGVFNYEAICRRCGWDILKVYVHTTESELLKRLHQRRLGEHNRLSSQTQIDESNIADFLAQVDKIDAAYADRVKSIQGDERRWLNMTNWDAIVPGDNNTKALQDIKKAIEWRNRRGL